MQNISRVSSAASIKTVAELAHRIWNQHFVPIIGQKQVDYMVDKFQSEPAISSQIENGYEYFLLTVENQPAGYLGLVPNDDEGKLMISKFYMDHRQRGKGFGGSLLHFAIQRCKKRHYKIIRLTVNRYNHNAIDWYKRKGFVVVDEVKTAIGSGFFMDDFIMQLEVS